MSTCIAYFRRRVTCMLSFQRILSGSSISRSESVVCTLRKNYISLLQNSSSVGPTVRRGHSLSGTPQSLFSMLILFHSIKLTGELYTSCVAFMLLNISISLLLNVFNCYLLLNSVESNDQKPIALGWNFEFINSIH